MLRLSLDSGASVLYARAFEAETIYWPGVIEE
jgi:hypothetical protein